MEQVKRGFSESSIASAKTIIEDAIDAAFEIGVDEIPFTLIVDAMLDVIASCATGETKKYSMQTTINVYSEVIANVKAKANLGAVITEWEDTITDSGLYNIVNTVEGSVTIRPKDLAACSSATFVYDPDNPETVAREDDVVITVIYGCPPFTWGVTGTGFSFADATTNTRTNTLSADDTACGAASVTVTDVNSTEVTGYVRCTASSDWADKGSYMSTDGGGVTGTPCPSCGSDFETIEGNKKYVGIAAQAAGCYTAGNTATWTTVPDGAPDEPPCGSPWECCAEGECDDIYGDRWCIWAKVLYYEWECV